MKLIEIYNQLTHGELAQINIGGSEHGGIQPSHYLAMASHVNLGLTALHKRFLIREGRLRVALQPGIYTYVLHSEYATSHRASRKTRYILDSLEEPFKDDIIKIERVYTDTGVELSLNDDSDPYTVRTPSMNVLRMPAAIVEQERGLDRRLQTQEIEVVYRANHPILNEDNGAEDPEDTEIELPYTYLEALLYFIASRINNPIGMTDEFHAGNNYMAKYEQECLRLEEASLRIDQVNQGSRLRQKGWP